MKLTDEYQSRMDGCQKKKTTNNLVATSLYVVAFLVSSCRNCFLSGWYRTKGNRRGAGGDPWYRRTGAQHI